MSPERERERERERADEQSETAEMIISPGWKPSYAACDDTMTFSLVIPKETTFRLCFQPAMRKNTVTKGGDQVSRHTWRTWRRSANFMTVRLPQCEPLVYEEFLQLWSTNAHKELHIIVLCKNCCGPECRSLCTVDRTIPFCNCDIYSFSKNALSTLPVFMRIKKHGSQKFVAVIL